MGLSGSSNESIVGADVLDGPVSFRKDLLSGKGSLRAVGDVGPYKRGYKHHDKLQFIPEKNPETFQSPIYKILVMWYNIR